VAVSQPYHNSPGFPREANLQPVESGLEWISLRASTFIPEGYRFGDLIDRDTLVAIGLESDRGRGRRIRVPARSDSRVRISGSQQLPLLKKPCRFRFLDLI